MAECLILGDEFEIEFWYETILVAPPNLPKLHAEGKVGYEWSGSFDKVGSLYSQTGTDDQDRLSKYVFKKTVELSDSEKPMAFEITVKASDLRFTQLDVSDSDSLTTDWVMPCVFEGNMPDFSVSDGSVIEGDSGTTKLSITVTASEAVQGKPITVEYCSKASTASTFSVAAQVKHAAYDKAGFPFLSYIEFQDVRAIFDASFPKYYNSQMAPNPTARGLQATQLLTNAARWLDNGSRGSRVLVIGEGEGSDYNVKKPSHSSGFGGGFVNHLKSLGYTVDVMYVSEAMAGHPSVAFFSKYTVTFYFSTKFLNKVDSLANPPLSNTFVNSIVTSVKQGMGLDIVTDHSDAEGYGFATAGNQIASKLYAKISGTIDRTGGTDFDAVRSTYGDHPLIKGMTGEMAGDDSEGKVDTTPPGIDNPKDYDDECGTLTFQQGEISKTIDFTVYGDTLQEGDENFYVDISNPSRGAITRSRGTAIILGDDVTPCGEGAGAGGTGIEWFDISTGSAPGVVVIIWESYSQHDRFDVFRNGVLVGGNMKEIEDYRVGMGLNVRNSIPYDYDLWKAKTSESNRAVTHTDLGTENFPGRQGSGVIFIPHLPDLGHPPVYQIRTDGPSGTAWAMTTYCEAQAEPAIASGGGPVTLTNTLWKSSDFNIHMLDLWANNPSNTRTFKFTFKPQVSWGNITDMFQGLQYKTYGTEIAALKSKLVLKSNNLVIGETPFIARGATASISYNFDKAVDYRYLEVHVICDIVSIPNMIGDYDTSLSSKMGKVRQLFHITVT